MSDLECARARVLVYEPETHGGSSWVEPGVFGVDVYIVICGGEVVGSWPDSSPSASVGPVCEFIIERPSIEPAANPPSSSFPSYNEHERDGAARSRSTFF